jgi:polar amino acid transport system permease protein
LFDLGYVIEILPSLLQAGVVTVEATLGGFALALVLGLVIAVLRLSSSKPISWTAQAYMEFIRGTPLLIQLFFLFYLLPQTGLVLPALAAGIVGLGINHSAYTAEVYRSGIEGVGRAQWEAAVALNLPATRTWSRVILPQAIPPVVPALGNYALSMFKDTALLSTITVRELLGTALVEAQQSFRYLEAFTLVGVLYMALSYPSALLIRRVETRFVAR